MLSRCFGLALLLLAENTLGNELLVRNLRASMLTPENGLEFGRMDNCSLDNVKTCEQCVNKGNQCFWCEKTQLCLNYEWYFPQCPLNEAKHIHCFVNWSSVVIVLSVIVAVLVLIAVSCMVWCCYRWNRCRRVRRRQQYMTEDERRQEQRIDMENRHEQRRMERKAMTDAIRQKYGINASPTFERMGSDRTSKLEEVQEVRCG
ncbi:hypothetical protein L596_025819 [Steinernema carpocapsae]|uniref:PSI domain-containing protein n=1 Tax=Steinernema carpocapsae TaxID=34508 RepID=A0A4U5MA46_STECR|nr:hypothetical protein L596_025819 [Steinernema carpocapsae]